MICKVQILRGTGSRMEFRSRKNFSTNNFLVCTLGTGIRFMTKITGDTHESLLNQHGKKGYGLIVTFLGTWKCQLLISIFLMTIFKMEVN